MDLRNLLENAQSRVSSTYDTGLERVLDRLGLEPKRDTMDVVLPALAIFGAGIAVGAALGILFAPKQGNELRGDLKHRIGDLKDRGSAGVQKLRERGSHLLHEEDVAEAPAEG